jgi:hypothetical protein
MDLTERRKTFQGEIAKADKVIAELRGRIESTAAQRMKIVGALAFCDEMIAAEEQATEAPPPPLAIVQPTPDEAV